MRWKLGIDFRLFNARFLVTEQILYVAVFTGDFITLFLRVYLEFPILSQQQTRLAEFDTTQFIFKQMFCESPSALRRSRQRELLDARSEQRRYRHRRNDRKAEASNKPQLKKPLRAQETRRFYGLPKLVLSAKQQLLAVLAVLCFMGSVLESKRSTRIPSLFIAFFARAKLSASLWISKPRWAYPKRWIRFE